MHRTRRIAAVLMMIAIAALAFTLPAAAGGRPYTTELTGAAERPARAIRTPRDPHTSP